MQYLNLIKKYKQVGFDLLKFISIINQINISIDIMSYLFLDQTGSKAMIIPIPVPVYIPMPMHMYVMPYPVPVPFPIPLPIPIFIPTTKNTTKAIMKDIQVI